MSIGESAIVMGVPVQVICTSSIRKKNERRRRVEPGMVLDFNKDGKLIGIELLAPNLVTVDAITGILKDYGLEPIKESDLAPLVAASWTEIAVDPEGRTSMIE